MQDNLTHKGLDKSKQNYHNKILFAMFNYTKRTSENTVVLLMQVCIIFIVQ